MTETITIYEPDNPIRKGYRSLFKEMAEEVRQSRWLTIQLFMRDFKAVYKQSVLGILWVLFVPLITLGVFVLLNRSGIFYAGDIAVPYPLFALLGIAFWQLFAVGLQSTTNSLTAAGSLIAKIKFPREALVVASMGQAGVAFLIQIVLVCALFIWYGVVPVWTAIFVPLTLVPIVFLALGLGFILSIANGVVRDIGKAMGIITTFLMLATPILYATPQSGLLGTITRYNPLYYLITAPRDLIIVGSLPNIWVYLTLSLLSVLLFFICWVIFHLTETRIAERI
ncbi:MAG: ABC transporter permease [Candidatus Thermoplasmatota archaeon]